MFHLLKTGDAKTDADQMYTMIESVLASETDIIANFASISAILMGFLDDVNWVGFYLLKEGELVLGPFQGEPACVRIALGTGVCGTAAAEKRIILVENVHLFPGHIPCDATTNAEIVLPIYENGLVFGVLDLDSQKIGRFSPADEVILAKIAEAINDFLSTPQR